MATRASRSAARAPSSSPRSSDVWSARAMSDRPDAPQIHSAKKATANPAAMPKPSFTIVPFAKRRAAAQLFPHGRPPSASQSRQTIRSCQRASKMRISAFWLPRCGTARYKRACSGRTVTFADPRQSPRAQPVRSEWRPALERHREHHSNRSASIGSRLAARRAG